MIPSSTFLFSLGEAAMMERAEGMAARNAINCAGRGGKKFGVEPPKRTPSRKLPSAKPLAADHSHKVFKLPTDAVSDIRHHRAQLSLSSPKPNSSACPTIAT